MQINTALQSFETQENASLNLAPISSALPNDVIKVIFSQLTADFEGLKFLKICKLASKNVRDLTQVIWNSYNEKETLGIDWGFKVELEDKWYLEDCLKRTIRLFTTPYEGNLKAKISHKETFIQSLEPKISQFPSFKKKLNIILGIEQNEQIKELDCNGDKILNELIDAKINKRLPHLSNLYVFLGNNPNALSFILDCVMSFCLRGGIFIELENLFTIGVDLWKSGQCLPFEKMVKTLLKFYTYESPDRLAEMYDFLKRFCEKPKNRIVPMIVLLIHMMYRTTKGSETLTEDFLDKIAKLLEECFVANQSIEMLYPIAESLVEDECFFYPGSSSKNSLLILDLAHSIFFKIDPQSRIVSLLTIKQKIKQGHYELANGLWKEYTSKHLVHGDFLHEKCLPQRDKECSLLRYKHLYLEHIECEVFSLICLKTNQFELAYKGYNLLRVRHWTNRPSNSSFYQYLPKYPQTSAYYHYAMAVANLGNQLNKKETSRASRVVCGQRFNLNSLIINFFSQEKIDLAHVFAESFPEGIMMKKKSFLSTREYLRDQNRLFELEDRF